MIFSTFGQRFTGHSGILGLMDDLGKALATDTGMLMLGGGNPSHIEAVEAIFHQRMCELLENPAAFARLIGNYGPPQGDPAFLEALAGLLRREQGWDIGPENIALTCGSQAAFFALFNLFGGHAAGGRKRRILFPLAPEYIGYGDLGLEAGQFTARRPRIELIGANLFKYHVDFDALEIVPEIAALCVSRPTNPSGNVLTDEEISRLSALAEAHELPLIIDNAYGTPFPDIIFTAASPVWSRHIVLCMSLSKLGLPGTRTGIVIADTPVIQALTSMNAVLNLANGNLGAMLALDMVRSGEILRISRDLIQPFYRSKMQEALNCCDQAFAGLDYRIHRPEGAMFLWLWFPGLAITSEVLYQRLKARGVLVVSGHHFFPGLQEDWRHRHECLRMTFTQDADVVRQGIRIIAEEVARAGTNEGRV